MGYAELAASLGTGLSRLFAKALGKCSELRLGEPSLSSHTANVPTFTRFSYNSFLQDQADVWYEPVV